MTTDSAIPSLLLGCYFSSRPSRLTSRSSGWSFSNARRLSAAAHVPAPYFAAYAASKSYTLALALALREEWRGRISVCAVCPGPVATEFAAVAGVRESTGARAEDVVALALRDALAGRAVSNAGLGPKLVAHLAGVLPRGLLVRLAGRRNLRRART